MTQFYSLHFRYDDKSSDNLGWMGVAGYMNAELVISNVDGSNDRILGLQRSINEEDSGGFAPSFLGLNQECPTFPVTLTCLDKTTGEVLPIGTEFMFELNRWLFQDEYKVFRLFTNNDIPNQNDYALTRPWMDMYYYAIFTSATQYNVNNGRGYINLEMRLDSPCAYSGVISNRNTSTGRSINVNLQTKFNVGQYIYPDYRFRLVNGGDITITNTFDGTGSRNSETMKFTNVPANHWVYCYNEGYKYIVDETVESYNVRKHLEPSSQWMRLIYGKNLLNVTTSTNNFDIEFLYQNKIAIQ